jgi:peptide deformylase
VIRPVLRYGERVLREAAEPLPAITADTHRLIDDMVDTMRAAPGIGLAAPQVGVPVQLFVIDLSAGRRPAELIVLANPEFVERDGMQLEEEGCLSVPGFTATVARPQRVVVRGLDRDGQSRTYEGTGLLARAFQHEMDHLNGTLFLDRLAGLRRALIVRRVRKLRRAGRW